MEWAWNVIWWVWKILTWQKWWISQIWQWIAQNKVWQFLKTRNDPNYIIKQIFSKPLKNDKLSTAPNTSSINPNSKKITPNPKPNANTTKSTPLIKKTSEKVSFWDNVEKDLISIEGRKFNWKPMEIDGKKIWWINYRVIPNDNKTILLSKIEIFPEYRWKNYSKKVLEKIFKDNPDSKEINLSSAKTAEPIWEKLWFKYQDHITDEWKLYKITRDEFNKLKKAK